MVSAKQVAAVAVALVVVVSAGSVFALSASADVSPRPQSDDGDVTAAGNETGNDTDNETVVGDNETNVTDDNETVGDNVTEEALVTFENQTSNGTVVTVQNVTVPEGGFVAIHDGTLFEGAVIESVVGFSDYLEPGTHENVTVELFANESFVGNETLVAMPHRDTNATETYDFVSSNGLDDGPYTTDDAPVVGNATVTFEEETVVDDNETDNVTEDNVTDNVTDDNLTDDNETEDDFTDDNETEDNLTDDNITDDNITDDNVTEDNVTDVTEDNVTEDNVTENVTDNVTEDNVTEEEELTTIGQSFEVTSMEVPSVVQTGETLVVEVTLTNPNDVMASQFVELRFSGVLVQFGEVTLDAGESETLRLGVPVEGLDNGLYVVSVLTSDDGEVRAVAVGGPPENVTNVTEPDNVTSPDNATENVTGDNVTNITDNVTNVTDNVTEDNVTDNVTDDNLTDDNVTEDNITEDNITEDNITEDNVTEDNVTNVTGDNVTEDNVTGDNLTEDNVTEDNVTEDNATEDNVTVVENQSFRVMTLDAPESVAAGETVTVNATIENPSDEAATQNIEFRVQGNLVERQTLTIDAGDSEEVTFTFDTTGLPEGQYIHGVLTRDFGQVAVLELTEENATDGNVTAGNESGDVQPAPETRA